MGCVHFTVLVCGSRIGCSVVVVCTVAGCGTGAVAVPGTKGKPFSTQQKMLCCILCCIFCCILCHQSNSSDSFLLIILMRKIGTGAVGNSMAARSGVSLTLDPSGNICIIFSLSSAGVECINCLLVCTRPSGMFGGSDSLDESTSTVVYEDLWMFTTATSLLSVPLFAALYLCADLSVAAL